MEQDEGFFKILFDTFIASLDKQQLEVFCKGLGSEDERLAMALEAKSLKSFVFERASEFWRGKDAKRCEGYREAGNAAFQAGKVQQAHLLYSTSILHAPVTLKVSDEGLSTPPDADLVASAPHMALALANRAACLQRAGEYELALRDLDLALLYGYPEAKSFKLWERKGKCLLGLLERSPNEKCGGTVLKATAASADPRHPEEAARSAFEKALKMHQGKERSSEQARRFTQSVSEAMKRLESLSSTEKAARRGKCQQQHQRRQEVLNNVRLVDGLAVENPHSIFDSSADDCLEVVYCGEQRGRGVFAKRRIPAGTTLVHEATPLAAVLAPDHLGTHCVECLQLIRANIPCTHCSQVNFCSLNCRNKSLRSGSHRYECCVGGFLRSSGLHVSSLLALRLVTTFGLEALSVAFKSQDLCLADLEPRWAAERLDFTTMTTSLTMREEGDPASFLVLSAYHHFPASPANDKDKEQRIVPPPSAIELALVAFLSHVLDYAGFFDQERADGKSNSVVLVAKLLLHFVRTLPANAHDVGELQLVRRNSTGGSSMVTVGAALYNPLSLFNHSCQASFVRANVAGSGVVCVATRDIEAGEEVFESYGVSWAQDDFYHRQQILSEHYGFQCDCPACAEKWPLKAASAAAAAASSQETEALSAVRKALIDDRDWASGKQKLLALVNSRERSQEGALARASRDQDVQSLVWEFLWLTVGNRRLTTA